MMWGRERDNQGVVSTAISIAWCSIVSGLEGDPCIEWFVTGLKSFYRS